jgi:hypothetical protein
VDAEGGNGCFTAMMGPNQVGGISPAESIHPEGDYVTSREVVRNDYGNGNDTFLGEIYAKVNWEKLLFSDTTQV